ncbi:DUF882 domain-containing protein [Camelimonas sp. ID_303_24]
MDRSGFRLGLGAIALAGATLTGASETQNAIANGDTRTLTLYYAHTKETISVTFKRFGSYDRAALKQLNWFLRDWRREEPTNMDPRLFDLVWEVHRELGSRETIHVLSAYRAPATNAMLRRRSGRVAEHSQHMLGKAMDFYLPDVPAARIRAAAVRLQRGGVGYYPSSYNPFVHLDVGSVRAWPRLSYEQLASIFPDGKTVHIPANGRPMARYELAKAEILARGGSVAGATAYAAQENTSKKGFWAKLFGGGSDEGEDVAEQKAIAVAPPYKPRTAKEAAATAQQVAWAEGNQTTGDAGLLGFFGGGKQQQAQQVAVAAPPPPSADRLPPLEPQPSRIAEMAPVPASRPQDPASLAAMRPDDDGQPEASPQMGIVPLPPRRPDDPELNMATAALSTDAVAANTIDAAMAPLPPVRPRGLGNVAGTGENTAQDDAQDSAPEAPAVATDDAAPAAVASAPLPPARPADLAGPSPEARAVAAITSGRRKPAVASDALAYAASPETTSALSPLPPQRPMELRGAAAAPRAGASERPSGKAEKKQPAARNAPATETRRQPETAAATPPRKPEKTGGNLPDRIANAYSDTTFSSEADKDDTGAAFARALLARRKVD